MSDSRGTGARCDQSGKAEAIKLLNDIIGADENKFTKENSKEKKKIEFCILQEMYLRYFNKINKNGKIWFLSPQKSSINKIEKIHI